MADKGGGGGPNALARKSEAKKATRREEQRHEFELARLRFRATMSLADKVYKLLRQAMGGGIVLGCVYLAYLCVAALAGKQTNAVFKALLTEGSWAPWTVSALMGIGWARERRLRRKTITETGEHVRQLEDRVDPNKRLSSGLQEDGQPTKEDKDAS